MKGPKLFVFISFLFLSSTKDVQSQDKSEIIGLWQARGYGWVIEIDAETVHIYDITKISCVSNVEYPLSMFTGAISVSNKVLTITRGVTQYTFNPILKLPDLCTLKLSKKKRKDPRYNFDVLWNSFNEQYAYFKERNVDWEQLFQKYRNQIHDKTTEVELFVICDAMLKELNDGHVDISASEKIIKKASILGHWDTRPMADFKGTREAIITKYVKTAKRHNLSRTVWGKINDSIGYLQINSMGVQGEYGITDKTTSEDAKKLYLKYLSKNPDPFLDDITGMNTIMRKVINDLSDTKKIILDLRFNGGGEDMVGLTALSHFVDSKKTVFHKKNRMGESYTPSYTYELLPEEKTYKGELYILQSHWSASATEVLLLSSMAYENIKRLGSSSEGIFSDILDKKLPNGWKFGLSNQIYEDNSGHSYEAKGIPVDIDFNYSKNQYEFINLLRKDIETTGDSAIEYILNIDIKSKQ
jgi:hypothetical protein